MAKYVCRDLCFRLKFHKGKSIPDKTRYFLFAEKMLNILTVLGVLTDAKRLRTIFPTTKN